MAVSPKVSSATVGASVTTLVIGILGPHLFPHGMPADVQGLVGAVVTAVVTFAAGWLAREVPALAKVEKTAVADVAKADVVFTKVEQAVAPVVNAVEAAPAPSPSQPVATQLPVQ